MAVQGIDSARFLSAEEKRDIFYNNAVRFFRMDRNQKVDLELSHSGQPWHRIERLEHIVGWFDHWLMGVAKPEYEVVQ